MKRRLDWPERLAAALEVAQSQAFSESYYCAAFAADVVLAMTDVDLLPVRHETTAEAYAFMRETHDSVLAALEAVLGAPVLLAFARRGDVVYSGEDGCAALGICVGVESVFISSDGGLALRPTLQQTAAFRVPF